MLRILADKLSRLGRDEDGVALVTTLAAFMFIYLVCMGVYAVGTAVKTRIHLQNACDAAAYSAAVVQADTLSRIATINRAMAWTYIQVSRRQMDWITYRWLEEVRKHWNTDHDNAKNWAELGSVDCSCTLSMVPQGLGKHASHRYDWDCSSITLYGARNVSSHVSATTIMTKDSMFRATHEGMGASFYSSSSMTGQIMDDWQTIEQMGKAIDDLKKKYDGSIEGVVSDIVQANLPVHLKLASGAPKCYYEKMESYTEELDNSKSGEDRFLSFVRETRDSAFGRSGGETGSGSSWFVRNKSGDKGFRRGYKWGNSVLRAQWTWFSYQWHCKNVDGVDAHVGPIPAYCVHPSHYRCSCLGMFGSYTTKVYADNDRSRHDPYYETPSRYRARPNKLKKDYFKKEGTITVGLAVENQNPWSTIMGPAITGLFSAFNIGGDVFPLYTVCFASAKAGYKETGRLNWGNTRSVETDDRAYRVDWEDGEWNLCQSDLDAVLIPVRRAESLASGGSWSSGNMSFLDGYARQLGASDTDMKAGDGDTWLVQKPGNPVDWNKMERVMLH